MELICLSRFEIESYIDSDFHIKIVIHDPDLEMPTVISSANCLDTLYLSFDDISYESNFDINFSDQQAIAVKRIVDKYKDSIVKIVVSCEKGVSRSAGLAAAIDEYLNGRESEIFYDSSKYPNYYVYRKAKLILK